MFTGIIQNQAIVQKRQSADGQVRFNFELVKQSRQRKIHLGQSIAVNGVCLTVAKLSQNGFVADVMKLTLDGTTLGSFKKGTTVNIERSLRHGDEIGGHFVTGHVDGTTKVLKIKKQGVNKTFTFSIPKGLNLFMAQKGSVALDGISLTVQKVGKKSFDVGIIPHTLKETNMKRIVVGSTMNLEVDLAARYLRTFDKVLPSKPSKLSVSLLKQNGF